MRKLNIFQHKCFQVRNLFFIKRFLSSQPLKLKKVKKVNALFRFGSFLSVLFQRLRNSRSVFELKLYYFLKKRYIKNLISYYIGLFEYYSDRVYEEGSEHKFNERIWISDLKQIKYSINNYIYKNMVEFLNHPFIFIKDSAISTIVFDNVKFWLRIIPQMSKEFSIILIEVFYSFYYNHDQERFNKKFFQGKAVAKEKQVVPKKRGVTLVVDLENSVEVKKEKKEKGEGGKKNV